MEVLSLPQYKFIDSLKELPFIKAIYLFGSRARGDHTKKSDIDLAIDCPNASAQDWDQIMDIVENADTLLKIDVVELKTANEELKQNITQEGIKIYEQD